MKTRLMLIALLPCLVLRGEEGPQATEQSGSQRGPQSQRVQSGQAAVPAPAIDAQRFAELLNQIDDDDFETREAASKALVDLGSGYKSTVAQALAQANSSEVRARLKCVLAAYRYMACEGEPVAGIQLALIPSAEAFEGRTGAVAKLKLELRNLDSDVLAQALSTRIEWEDHSGRVKTQKRMADMATHATLQIRVSKRHLDEKIIEELREADRIETSAFGLLARGEKKALTLNLRLREGGGDWGYSGHSHEKIGESTSENFYEPGEYEVEVSLLVSLHDETPNQPEVAQKTIRVLSNKVRIKITQPEPQE